MKKMILVGCCVVFFGVLIFSSCKKEEDTEPAVTMRYDSGYFITNEGSYGNGNGSISYFDTVTKSVTNGIFKAANSRTPGDVIQSMVFIGSKGYIIANNSQKVEVVDKSTFVSTGVITELKEPRYMISNDGVTGYISQWGENGVIKVVDLLSNAITSTIPVGSAPENMLILNSKLFVANCGGWSSDSTITVINTVTNTVVATITVGFNPDDFEIDANGMIWVLCKGKEVYDNQYNLIEESASMLVKIDPSNNTVLGSYIIGEQSHPADMAASPDKSILYYGSGYGFSGLFAFNVNNPVISTSSLVNSSFYGVEVNPANGEILGLIAPNFTGNGEMHRYSSNGIEIGVVTVGIGPNGVAFR